MKINNRLVTSKFRKNVVKMFVAIALLGNKIL